MRHDRRQLWIRLPLWGRYLALLVLSFGLCAIALPSFSQSLPHSLPHSLSESLVQRGEELYNAGQFSDAVMVLEREVQQAQATGQVGEQIRALRNLALVYQAIGQWEKANQAIVTALPLVSQLDVARQASVQAGLFEVQGMVQFEQGQTEAALATWERASQGYGKSGDQAIQNQAIQNQAIQNQINQNQINQNQALQRLGFYRRSIEQLTPIVETLATQPDSLLKAASLQNLAEAERLNGNFDPARLHGLASLEIATRLQNPTAIATATLTLGNIFKATGKVDEAIAQYQKLSTLPISPILGFQGQLNQLRLWIDLGKPTPAKDLWPQLVESIDRLPESHTTIFARINLAQSLLKWRGLASSSTQASSTQAPSTPTIAQLLATAVQQARRLQDQRAESYAIGTLGTLYEQTGQWVEARKLTDQALQLAQTQRSVEIGYRWQWQLGRLYQAEGEYGKALTAYGEAVQMLQSLRTDLAATQAQVQVSFQDSVEPIHREFVSLLLDGRRGNASAADLEKALKTIESLQLAELDNFFREACLKTSPVNIDQVDLQAAVIYPIVLRDRIEVIVSLPHQKLRHYSTAVSQADVEKLVRQLRQSLVLRVGNQYLANVQKLYDWIIRPAEAELKANQVKTLVFVLDSLLRNLPMAALHNGKQFLIENYSIALTPGMQLVNPRPLQDRTLEVLTVGLSESRQGFSALPQVYQEIKEIQASVPSQQVLLNQAFTESAFRQAVGTKTVPIVHVATHGKFSSKKDETFVLTWDNRLGIEALNGILQESDLNQANPIELLVLSACETATGDRLAALGMAGMAVRAGARSTVASLWQINDEATALLMNQFYAALAKRKVTKAEALRQAQLAVLKEPRFRQHPYFWSPFVLVGNWL